MPRREPTSCRFTFPELVLLVTLIVGWLGITLLVGTLSLMLWGGGIVMTAVWRPSHQRRPMPETVTDVISVAICWSVAWGIGGLILDYLSPVVLPRSMMAWTLLGQLTGFYLGMVWVLVMLLARHVVQVVGGMKSPRPLA